jgi:hypothetical protein
MPAVPVYEKTKNPRMRRPRRQGCACVVVSGSVMELYNSFVT